MEKHFSTAILFCIYEKEAHTMTLAELSRDYEESARQLRLRICQLRKAIAQSDDPEEKWHLQRRIAELTPILNQMRELADLTAHYYDKGFWRKEKYTL